MNFDLEEEFCDSEKEEIKNYDAICKICSKYYLNYDHSLYLINKIHNSDDLNLYLKYFYETFGSKNQILKKLFLGSGVYKFSDFQKIFRYIKFQDSLEEFGIFSKNLSPITFKQFSELFNSLIFTKLKIFHFNQYVYCSNYIKIRNFKISTHLKKLILSGCGLDDSFIYSFLESLKKKSKSYFLY